MFLFVAVELGKYLAAKTLVTIVHIEVNGGEYHNLYCRINPRLANENADKECDAAPVEGEEVGVLHQWQTALAEVIAQVFGQLVGIFGTYCSLEFLKPRCLLLLRCCIVDIEELEEFLQRLLAPLHLAIQLYLL